MLLRLGKVLFAPTALAATGAKEVSLCNGVRCVYILHGGWHDVTPTLRTHEGAGIAVECASDENTAEQSDKSDRDEQHSHPHFHFYKSGNKNK